MDGPLHCPYNISDLHYDTACLQISNSLPYTVDLFTVSSDCVECDETYWATVPFEANISLVIPAVHSVSLSAFRRYDHESPLCQSLTYAFKQHEVVSLNISSCSFTTVQDGEDAYLPSSWRQSSPLLRSPLHRQAFDNTSRPSLSQDEHHCFTLFVACVFLVCLSLFTSAARVVWQSQWLQNLCRRDPIAADMQNDLGNPSMSSDSLPLVQSELVPRRFSAQRVLALDTFRGITISVMIFVNYGGGQYWIFEHSAWNGLTIADLVFPWFAWVMGVSLVVSYRSKLRSCVSRSAVVCVSLHRALVLITLGLVINMYQNNDLANARFCGVLQRLGVAHLTVSTLEIAFMKRQPSFQYGRWQQMSELLDSWRQWIVVAILAGVQVAVSLYRPVPGCPTGYLGPGGVSNHSATPLCTGGVARYIDSLVFDDRHLYSLSPAHQVYRTTVPFDPEGLLGTLTTCLTVYLGVQCGYIILCYNSTLERTARWLLWAILTGVSAGILCDWSQEGGLIPVNKQLWSLSFALVTASLAFVSFSLLFVVIDHYQWWSGGPFKHAGMNAILLYVGHIITKDTFPWSWKVYNPTTHAEVLAMNIGAVALWLLIARVLHRNSVFLTL